MQVSDWPTLNALAWLRLPCCGAEHPTRVEDVGDDELVVGAPAAPHGDFVKPFRHNEGFILGWVMGRGAMEVPVALVTHEKEPIPTWTLRAIGDLTETQRRNFVRVPIAIETAITFRSGAPAEQCLTDDLSEGGMRLHVSKWVVDPKGSQFDVRLQLGDRVMNLAGRVAWWGNLNEEDRRSVGIRFVDIEPKESDTIRAFVFAAEIERRRKSP